MTMAERWWEKKSPDCVRDEFEWWVKTERNQSTDRYSSYPKNYKNTDVDTLWQAWKAAHSYYTSMQQNKYSHKPNS